MNVRNLVFFNSDGYQIPIHYENNILFQIVGNTYSSDRNYGWREDAYGYCSVDENDKIIEFVFENNGSTFGFEKSEVEENEQKIHLNYFDAVRNLVDEIIFSIDGKTISYSKDEYDLESMFDIQIGRREISVRNSVDSDDGLIYEYYIASVSIKEDSPLNSRQLLKVEEGVKLFPSQRFMGDVMMEPVSTELVSTQTIFVMERVYENGEIKFVRPRSTTQNLRFEFFNKQSTTRFIKYREQYIAEDMMLQDSSEITDESKVYWSHYTYFDLRNDDNKNDDEPLIFTLGFTSKEEGCFQDSLTVMAVDGFELESELAFNRIGFLILKNEAIGEDERYRTLFANFGIPDPKTYPNLFKDLEVYEEGTDWKYINEKSKELFLTYSDIFPYVGTYKALINAVNYLGYDDVYFKEWYKFFDGEAETSIAYQSVDIINGQTLSSKLARIGVSLDDFIEWKKLNKLSMMYKINQETEPIEVLAIKDNDTGRIKATKTYQIPRTIPEYTYLNVEVLAKLYALREWLQTYILNINCQIIDITGEGVYFERYKEQAHPSPVYTQFDFVNEEYLSPIFITEACDTNLHDSSANMAVSIKEITKDLTYARLEGKTYEDYFQFTTDLNFNRDDILDNLSEYVTGKSLLNLTPFDSVEFELYTYSDCGTLKKDVGYYDESGAWKDLPLLVKDNEISTFGYLQETVEFRKPPVIRVKSGNLRRVYGRWCKNIEYKIEGYFDTERTRTRFCIQHIDGTTQEVSDDYITFYPSKNASLKYTAKNKYDVPMLIMEGYDTFNKFLTKDQRRFDEPISKFILEIDEGFIDKEEDSNNDNGTTCQAILEFEPRYNVNNANEQQIQIKYVYRTPSMLFQEWDEDKFRVDVVELFDDFVQARQELYKKIEDLKRLKFFDIKMNIDEDDEKFGFLKTSDGGYLSDMNGELIETRLASYTEDDLDDIIVVEGYDDFLYLDIFKDGQFLKILFENQTDKLGVEEQLGYYRDIINNLEQNILNDETYVDLLERQIEEFRGKLDNVKAFRAIAEDNYQIRFENVKDKWMHIYETQISVLVKRFLENIEKLKNASIRDLLSVNINVNHIGEYHLVAKAKDGYNIPYVNECDYTWKVYCGTPNVYVGDYREREGNDSSVQLKYFDARPWFIPEYPRIIEDVDYEEQSIQYLDFSYFMDTPKKNDYLQITNASEKIDAVYTSIETLIPENYPSTMKFIQVIMNDETAGNQNVFYLGQKIYIVCIDKNSGDLADMAQNCFGPYTVVAYKPIPETDRREENDNFLILGYDEEDVSENILIMEQNIIDQINSKEVFCHAIPCGRFEILVDDIENDYASRTSRVKIKSEDNGSNMMVAKGQNVKVMFSILTWEGKTHQGDDLLDQVTENYISGTTYKCIDSYYDYEEFKQVYVLDGLVNRDLCVPKVYTNGVYNKFSENADENLYHVPYKVRASLAFTHQNFVSYQIKTTKDSVEDNTYGVVDYSDNWFARDYIDNTFVFRIRKFDTRDAFDEWEVGGVLDQTIQTYTTPVDERYGDLIHVYSVDDKKVFNDLGYLSIWNVYQNEDKDKSDEYLLYELINDEIDIKLKHYGEYHFELTAIDFFGNRSTNHSQGFLKSK